MAAELHEPDGDVLLGAVARDVDPHPPRRDEPRDLVQEDRHEIGAPLLHRLPGVLIGETYLILPYAVLVLVAALDRIDPRLVPAARGLGAGPLGAFVRVTLPLSVPGLTLAATISLIWALGAFISPYLLGSPQELTLAVDVQKQTFENLNWPRGAADAMLMLVAISLCLLSYRIPARYLRRRAGPS